MSAKPQVQLDAASAESQLRTFVQTFAADDQRLIRDVKGLSPYARDFLNGLAWA